MPLVEIPKPTTSTSTPDNVPALKDPRTPPDLSQFTPSEQPETSKPPVPPSGLVSLTEFGIKEYPGALIDNQERSVEPKGDEKSLNLSFFTKDSPAKVADFFSKLIKSNKSKSVTKDTAVVGGITEKGANAFIVASKLKDKTQVTVTVNLKKQL
ncbi:MAG: hypothetical protein KF824_06765 [Fimbriimonadaceae bacterium]|nr:MAG: hypothetical protein KF824_06765 [Fimbriimonadaceae bacterium]